VRDVCPALPTLLRLGIPSSRLFTRVSELTSGASLSPAMLERKSTARRVLSFPGRPFPVAGTKNEMPLSPLNIRFDKFGRLSVAEDIGPGWRRAESTGASVRAMKSDGTARLAEFDYRLFRLTIGSALRMSDPLSVMPVAAFRQRRFPAIASRLSSRSTAAPGTVWNTGCMVQTVTFPSTSLMTVVTLIKSWAGK
jgi:hypothetical protein